ncbi:TetR/AcrR family transcriptional regulator [Kribbella sp. NBC_01505]|uniref:TetR/AcrR family transcriptional regulator n=1 Tax=Kribbella sp. NBC_01505 TaxID=2903580 RepID=UPI00386FB0E2
MGTQAERKPRMTRETRGAQLLDVAEGLFATRGFEGTSMEDIARHAGVTRPMVYQHYPTKDAIYLECVRRARAELEEKIREPEVMIEAGAGIGPVMERAGEVFFSLLERDPQRWMVLFNPSIALSKELSEQLTEMRRQTITRIAGMLRHLPTEDDVRVLAFSYAVSGVGEQLGRWWLANPEVPRSQVVALFRDFTTGGLTNLLHGEPD